MRRSIDIARVLILTAPLWLPGATACGDVQVTVEVLRGDAATEEFKFQKVPTPSASDAANQARLTIVDGERDGNGGETAVLRDGRLPTNEDDPRSNFFFDARSSAGRLLMDLGADVEVQQVNTYSWHPEGRGPQRYKLYAYSSADQEFAPASARSEDLLANGWKLLAEVNTLEEAGEPGGQYGVSIAGSDGKSLGKSRRLLFEISPSGAGEAFDKTFFSEIDVIDGKEHPPAAGQVVAKPDVMKVGDRFEIAFDTAGAPEIKPWVDETLKPICAEWYPKIVDMLPSEQYQAPTRFTIVFHADMDGVANTAGRQVNCAVPWFLNNLDGEAAGAVVHELVHVVQQYGRRRGANRSPGWLVEGVADYIRWFRYEPENLRPRPNPDRAHYTDSYRTTAAFLDFVVDKYDKELIPKFNTAMREGQYSDDLWKEYTGKTVDELWKEYVETLRK